MKTLYSLAIPGWRSASALLFVLLAALVSPLARGQSEAPVLRPGYWVEIKDSKLRDVGPAVSPGGNLAKVVDAWSGAALDTKRDRLMVWGGGHSNYAGNEVYAFDLHEFRWLRLSDPSPADDSKEAVYPDGQPRSRHTYDYLEYVPAWDRLVSFGGSGPWPRGGGEFTREISEFDLAERRWVTGERAAVPPGGSMIAALAQVDPATGNVFFVPGARGAMLRLDPVTGKWEGGWERSRLTAHATGAIDPERRLLVAVGLGNRAGNRQALSWDLDRRGAPTDLTELTQGDTEVERAIAPGFVYHPPTRRFVAWIGGTDLYTLDPETWRWEKVPAAKDNEVDPGPQSPRGTYGRFQYVPRLDAFVLVNSVDQNVHLIKPDFSGLKVAADDRAGPPVVELSAIRSASDPSDALLLSWSAYGANHCEAAGSWTGSRKPFGSERVVATGQGVRYSLICAGNHGSAEATATDPGAAVPVISLAAEPRAVNAGEATTIRWQASGAGLCNARNAWHGPRAGAGSERTPVLLEDSTFELICDDGARPTFARVRVQVVQAKTQNSAESSTPGKTADEGGIGTMDLMAHAMLMVLGTFAALRNGQLRATT